MTRNAMVFLAVAVAWVFFFVPNPLLSFIESPGHERFPRVVYFSMPVVLAAISIFATVGGLRTRVGLALCLPPLHFVLYLLTAVAGVYSDSRATTENAAVIAGLVVISFVLLWISFRLVPLEAMPVVNLIGMPFLLGLAAGYLLYLGRRLGTSSFSGRWERWSGW